MLFGTAGVPNSTNGTSTAEGIKRIRELSLDCMEVQFVRGVRMNEQTARNIRMISESLNVRLSVHAPYYINLNADSEMKVRQSMQRILDTARIGSLMGARDIIFHPGYYMKRPRDVAFRRIREAVEKISETAKHLEVILRPETSGRREQFGELDEIIELCRDVDSALPCIDISHIHARTGKFNTEEEFSEIMEKIERELGRDALKKMHIHISGIDYGVKGEKSHLNLRESDFNYRAFLMVVKEFSADGMLICESPNLEDDAVMLKKVYSEL